MKKKSNLRVINRGAVRYDISGNMRSMVRRIESGEIRPRDVVILTSETSKNNASPSIAMHHFGFGTVADIHWMLATAQTRIEPS